MSPLSSVRLQRKPEKKLSVSPKVYFGKWQEELENRCWSNVILSRPLLDDLVEFMRRHKTYGPTFIEYDLRKEDRPLILKGVDYRHRVAMSNYFFNSDTNWYSVLCKIVTTRISIPDGVRVKYLDDSGLEREGGVYRAEPIDA